MIVGTVMIQNHDQLNIMLYKYFSFSPIYSHNEIVLSLKLRFVHFNFTTIISTEMIQNNDHCSINCISTLVSALSYNSHNEIAFL